MLSAAPLVALLLALPLAAPQDPSAPADPEPPAAPTRPARDEPAAEAAPERLEPPPLQLAQWLVAERPLVVLGTVRSVRDVGLGVEVLRLEVEEELHDPRGVTDGELLVIAHAGHARREQRGVYCLTPFRTGSRWEIAERVLASEPHYAARQELLRRAVGLLALPRNELRRAAAFELVVQGLSARDDWRPRWALDELTWLAAAHPEVLVPARRQRLAALASRLPEGPLRAGVESVAARAPSRSGP